MVAEKFSSVAYEMPKTETVMIKVTQDAYDALKRWKDHSGASFVATASKAIVRYVEEKEAAEREYPPSKQRSR